MPVTNSTTLTSQYQNYFSKQLLKVVEQETILDQFADKTPIPKSNGNKAITVFRFGAPSISQVQTISTEGSPIAAANYRALSMSSLSKTLAQYAQVIGLTDVLTMTNLFNSLQQASTTSGKDMALWVDCVIRNTLVGSNLLPSGASIGSGPEGSGTFENSDGVGVTPSSNGVCVYGNPATLAAQTFAGLSQDQTTANTYCTATALLDMMTRLKRNRAPMLNGGYVYATDPRIARDLMRDNDWLNASNYGNKGEPLYKGEVGRLYGCRVVVQTNSFVSTAATATENNKFVYQTSSNGGGTGQTADVIASFLFGGNAYAIPALTGDDPLSPKTIITDTPDKSDPLNQLITVGVKLYFAALRLAAGNTAGSGNPAWYLVHRCKTGATL